jgi:hypothetical protein
MIRTRWALVTLVATCLLGACSDDDPEPDIADPTPSVSSSSVVVSPSPTTEPPTEPDPEETVRAWIAARNQALQDGDTSAVDALSASDCRSCEELNKVIRQIYAAGGAFHTPGWTVVAAKEKPGSKPVQVDTALTFAAGQTTPSAGADPVSYDEEKHIVTFKLSKVAEGYRVQLVLFLS